MEEKKLTKNDLVHAIVAISDSIMENLDIIMDDGFPESVGFQRTGGAGLYHKRGGMYTRCCCRG